MHQLFDVTCFLFTVTASACKLISLIGNTPGSQRVSWPSQRCKSSRCCWWLLLIPTAGDEVANPTEGGLQPVTARSRGPEMSTRAPATASRSPATMATVAATQQPPPGKPRYSISEPCHIFLLTVGPFCRWGGCADPCYPPVTMPHYVFFSPFWEIFCRAICTWARISYLESCPQWVVLPNCPQMRGDHLYATLTTSLLFYQSAPYNGHKTVLSAEKNAIMLVLCKVCRSNIDHEKTSRLIGDCLRLLLLTWTIWNLHPWLLMCTLVMDPSHGTLDIFHFEEVIYIFSNIFEVTNLGVSQWEKITFWKPL